jgi:acyl dehydratase
MSGEDITIGSEFASDSYLLDAEAAHAYSQAIEGPPRRRPPAGIHNDDAAAQRAGFKAPIAGGEQTYALLAQLLVDRFGIRFLRGGRLEVSFIKPVFFGDRLTSHARVIETGAQECMLEVWVENQDSVKVAIGRAKVPT